jgi:hypothetical protein
MGKSQQRDENSGTATLTGEMGSAFGLDGRTVASWRDRAGAKSQRVQEAVVQSGTLSLTQGPR